VFYEENILPLSFHTIVIPSSKQFNKNIFRGDKMKKILVTLFLLIIINQTIFPQFELRYPDIPSDQINDIFFLDELTGFFVNSGGSVLMTTDGGITWKIKAHFQRNTFSEIKFIDDENGFAISPHSHIGDDVSFIYTTNRGLNWNEGNVYMGDALTFVPLSLSNILKSSMYDGTINKLDNFFGNWVEAYRIPYFLDDDLFAPYGDILQFQQLSNGRILALGSSWRAKNANVISDSVSFILKSDDLGSSWDTLWCDLPYASQTFTFINDSIGWLGAEQNRIYKTTDGGIIWIQQYSDSLREISIKSVSSADDLNVFAVDASGRVIYSHNSGVNWDFIQVGQGYDHPYKIKFLNSSKGFLAGWDSLSNDFWTTGDGGINWERVSKSIKGNLRKIDFANENIGMGVGENFIYKTLDGGKNWKIIYESSSDYFSGLSLIDSLNVWVVGYDSLYKTSDGFTWISSLLNQNIEFMRGAEFLDNYTGIIYEVRETLGDTAFNYVTTDGGSTWRKYPINYQNLTSYFKVKFTDIEHLWFVNLQGVWLSRDTAKTWELIKPDGSFFSAFDFVDSLNGLFAEDVLYYTADGGLTWKTKDKPYTNQSMDALIYGRDYFGRYNALIAGFDGSLIRYMPDDVFIYQIPTYTSNPLYSFASYKKDNKIHIWLAGDGMTILYTEEFVTDVNETFKESNLSYFLSQNYPNPFNPSTNIGFRIAEFGFVILKIYNVLGKEVATLINEEKQPGVYEVEFDASQLSSGIYFYKLQTENYSSTKKMIYLK
jgi:photosystem II stability/assembly factor-like uncharacterized protein